LLSQAPLEEGNEMCAKASERQETSAIKFADLYVGLWFPLGSNNILALGEKLFEYDRKLRNGLRRPLPCFRGSDPPKRLGNELVWNLRLSVYSHETDYLMQSGFRWQGNGYACCEGTVASRQNGRPIKDLLPDLTRQAFEALSKQLVDVVSSCLLAHQENYARLFLFGEGLSAILNQFDPESVHVDEEIRSKIMAHRMEKGSSKASDEQVMAGLEYLTHQVVVFDELGNRVLCQYHEDFQHDDIFEKPLSPGALYRKGRYGLAYDLSLNSDMTNASQEDQKRVEARYRERRGTIALSRSVASADLIDLLICLNSGLQFTSLIAYELGAIRRDIIKARRWLVRKDEFDEIMTDYFAFLESKLPVVNELIDFVEYDLKPHVDLLFKRCEDGGSIRLLSNDDEYFSEYPLLFNSNLSTLKRIRAGLTEEAAALNEYIQTQVQQQSIRLTREAQVATTRSLETQVTLAEFQRAGVLKGARTKWLSALGISGLIASTGVWGKAATILWNMAISLYYRGVGLLNIQTTTPLPAAVPDMVKNSIQVVGVVVGAVFVGQLILLIERGIPDIVQASFDLDPEVELEHIKRFVRTKNVRSVREDGHRFKVTWCERIPIWLNLEEGDWIEPSSRLGKLRFKIKFKYASRYSNLRRVFRPGVCSLVYELLPPEVASERMSPGTRARLQGLSITVDRDSSEASEGYIHAIHTHAAKILRELLAGMDDQQGALNYILTVTNDREIQPGRRHYSKGSRVGEYYGKGVRWAKYVGERKEVEAGIAWKTSWLTFD